MAENIQTATGSRNVPEEQELSRLRSLLFNKEIATIDELTGRLDELSGQFARFKPVGDMADPKVHAEKISAVLSEAVLLSANKDETLAAAMEPVVNNIVKSSLRNKMQEFTNALFPLMGPAIRKAIAESFRAMMEGFSKGMEMTFSWKGLRWRFEALRTGKTFSEVVLLHTLVYRVEQVFFIHSATGISIEHVVGEGVDSQDADMVSAMLTAIQDFVQDCLASCSDNALESMQHGEHVFLVEKSPIAYIACTVRGTPPVNIREKIALCLETLLTKYHDELENFNGDTAPFIECRPHMEKLLDAHYVDEDKTASRWAKFVIVMLLALIIGGCGLFKYRSYQAETAAAEFKQQMYAAVDLLRSEPGIEITHVDEANEGSSAWRVFCLKDRLARGPEEVLSEYPVELSNFLFYVHPYTSYEIEIVRRNVKQQLNPPPGVNMSLNDQGVLSLSGTATLEWIIMARSKAIALPGVTDLDIRGLSDPRMDRLKEMTAIVEGVSINFPLNSDAPYANDMPKLVYTIDTLVAIEKLAESMGMSTTLTIYGHADPSGTDKRNYEISQARARTIVAMLYNRESNMPVLIYGMGAGNFQGGRSADIAKRRIELRLRFNRNVQGILENLKF
jgi:OOP family OmpA-OmpF porin